MHRLLTRTLLFAAGTALIAAPPAHAEVKVFLMAGQSNMQGHGLTEESSGGVETTGTLRDYVNTNPAKYGHLVDGANDWIQRPDVWVWGRQGGVSSGSLVNQYTVSGDLTPGYGASSNQFGPEVGFGHAVGDAFDDQVVLVKTAWGGASLAELFRSPTAVSKRGGTVGEAYNAMIAGYQESLTEIAAQFPGETVKLEGLAWHQGFNDRLSRTFVDEYEANLKDLIADVRTELDAPDLKVVIGTTSTGSETFFHEENRTGNPGNAIDRVLDHVQAQKNVGDDDPLATTIDTRPFWREAEESPRNQGYHWNQNGESYYLIGENMGEAMVTLVPEPSSLALLGLGGLLVARRRRG